jgi:hypothetical protein
MAIDPIPDLLAELRAGRCSFDFIEALIGTETNEAPALRAMLMHILDGDDGAQTLTNLLLYGARRTLSELGRSSNGERRPREETDAALERMAALSEDYSLNREAMFWT